MMNIIESVTVKYQNLNQKSLNILDPLLVFFMLFMSVNACSHGESFYSYSANQTVESKNENNLETQEISFSDDNSRKIAIKKKF